LTAADFTATIDWGDDSTPSPTGGPGLLLDERTRRTGQAGQAAHNGHRHGPDDAKPAVVIKHVERGDDVRMVEQCRRPRLPVEPFASPWHQFDRDSTAELWIMAAIDLNAAVRADLCVDHVPPDPGPVGQHPIASAAQTAPSIRCVAATSSNLVT